MVRRVTARRLDRDDWVAAGLAALERGGVEAVAIVPLARELGVTRGSFYWHFASRDELLGAVLERWEHEHCDAVLDALARIADPRARLSAMLERAVRSRRRSSSGCSTPPIASRSSRAVLERSPSGGSRRSPPTAVPSG